MDGEAARMHGSPPCERLSDPLHGWVTVVSLAANRTAGSTDRTPAPTATQEDQRDQHLGGQLPQQSQHQNEVAVATYGCVPGYALIGAWRRECDYDNSSRPPDSGSSWSGVEPRCEGRCQEKMLILKLKH